MLVGRAKMRTIKVTGVLILGFILTWGPYQGISLIYFCDRTLFDWLDDRFKKLLWNCCSMSNIINPFLYSMYEYGPPIISFNSWSGWKLCKTTGQQEATEPGRENPERVQEVTIPARSLSWPASRTNTTRCLQSI